MHPNRALQCLLINLYVIWMCFSCYFCFNTFVSLVVVQKKLIMVGSSKTLSGIPLLRLLLEKVNEQDGIVPVTNKDVHFLKVLGKCSQMNVQ